MKKSYKIGCCSLNQTALDFAGNQQRIISALVEAQKEGIEILCFPELVISGYGCDDWFGSESVLQESQKSFLEILPHTKEIFCVLGFPLKYGSAVYNTAAICVNGKLMGLVPKQHLPSYGVHYEPRYFKAWTEETEGKSLQSFDISGQQVPFGPQIFNYKNLKIAVEICEDAWVEERPLKQYSEQGVDLVLNPSASHFAFGKHELRRKLVRDSTSVRSKNHVPVYAYANYIGLESGRIIYDGGNLISVAGQICNESQRFSLQKFQLISSEINFERLSEIPSSTLTALSKHEEFVLAVSLGLYDYLRKSSSKCFVISLSGGADSSTLACLVAMMAKRLKKEVDRQELKKQLPNLDLSKPLESQLLICAYQSTVNSSDNTRNSATGLARVLKADFYDLDIQELVTTYQNLIEKAVDRKLSWTKDDLTLQNIQARVRSPSIWMLANILGGLLLTTSNRSEAAVGYATMDGDTSGGLCPLGGLDKAYIREFLQFLEKHAILGFGPIPELNLVNNLAPTAELRPHDALQTDEKDLMPYSVLDFIERQAIGKKKSPKSCLEGLKQTYAKQYNEEQLKAWIKKFFVLWSRSQWKRERIAATFHLDDYNLAATTGNRFPILNGGFERELDEL